MLNPLQQAYDTGVLNPAVHGRLVQNLDQYADRAGVSTDNVLFKMSQFGCTENEIAYVKGLKRAASAGVYGLVYTGKESSQILSRMSGIAGACLRNFIQAKVMVLRSLLQDIKEGNPPDATVLLIPNFFNSRADGGKIADWDIAELLGLLYSRRARGHQTLVYVSDIQALSKAYGDPIASHICKEFSRIDA